MEIDKAIVSWYKANFIVLFLAVLTGASVYLFVPSLASNRGESFNFSDVYSAVASLILRGTVCFARTVGRLVYLYIEFFNKKFVAMHFK